MRNGLCVTLSIKFCGLLFFFLTLKFCLNSCETMDKGYWGEKIDFISFEYIPEYFPFINIGKCEIKANTISEEITFIL